jgi:hypothetical protein
MPNMPWELARMREQQLISSANYPMAGQFGASELTKMSLLLVSVQS